MPTCPYGHEVDTDVAFCRQCGAPLAPLTPLAPLAPLAPPDEPTVVLPVVPPVPPAPRAHAAHPAQSNTAVYVLAGIIVLIGLVGIGLALILGSGTDSGRPTPIAQTVPTPSGGSSPSTPIHPSTSPSASAVPAGGAKCTGTLDSGGEFGTIGSETSCGFVQAVARSYRDTAGLNAPAGQSTTVTATSPTTHRTYSNLVCTASSAWVTCVGGNNDTARMFFAHP